MNEALSFKDLLKNGALGMGIINSVSLVHIITNMAVTLILALFIFWIYKTSSRNATYNYTFNVVLVMMALITSSIIITISSNVILSLGMVGALSIIRFRTPVKEPMDIIFLFWAIAIGIISGAGLHAVSVIASLFIGLTLLIFKRINDSSGVFLLVTRYKKDKEAEVLEEIKNNTYKLKSKNSFGDTTELIVEINIKKADISFSDKISQIEGVESCMIVRAGNGNEF